MSVSESASKTKQLSVAIHVQEYKHFIVRNHMQDSGHGDSPEYVQCSNKHFHRPRCTNTFPKGRFKQCADCREKARLYGLDYRKSESGKAATDRFKNSEKGVAHYKRTIESAKTEHSKSVRKAYRDSDAGREAGKRGWKKWAKTPGGKKTIAKVSKRRHKKVMADPGLKMMARVTSAMSTMVSGSVSKYWRVTATSTLGTPSEVRAHFEQTFDTGMNFSNHGNGDGQWNIGHRIAKAMFDPSNEEDMKRCWNPANLFAQWRKQNIGMGVKLPSTEKLLELRHLWPVAWNNVLPCEDTRRVLEMRARKGVKK